MSIAEKLTTIAENTPKIFKSGQDSMIDHSKVIEKTVTANSIVSLNDVSEIPHSVGVKVENKNLFDKDSGQILNVTISSTNIGGSFSSAYRSVYVKCEPNTTYTVSRKVGTRFSVATTIEKPAPSVAVYGIISNHNGASITITTDSDAQYIIAYVWISSDTITPEEVIESVQIELGTTATPYTPYVKLCGKNLFDGKIIA